ncbi:MAG: hypothetical protein IJM97_02330 [Clostridia bacterium]|nr:hypothetical protein [Clostridia bacterium]MBQ6707770.1 hypothetical protein [Clostridia bacterium]
MKKRIISIVLIVVAVLSVTLFQNTFAWFTVDSYLTQSFIVGDVNYELNFTAEEDTREYIIPGDDVLLGTFELINKSTISTEIRFKIVDTVRPEDTGNFEVTFIDSGKWSSKDDGYYYYGTLTTDENGAEVFNSQIPEANNADGVEISFIDSIKYKGDAIEKDEYSGKDSTVILKFQAKQGEYATWEDIGEFKI